jgi:hypothetical protein
MERKLIVAVFGARGAGKDTFARAFVEAGFAHEKFAAPLKAGVQAMFGLSDDQIHGVPELGEADPRELPSVWGPSPRRILQFFGTEVFQHGLADLLPDMQREFWARSLVRRVARSSDARVVISDMRFPHELAVLRQQTDWDVVSVLVRRASGGSVDAHSSETEHLGMDADHIVVNDGVAPMSVPPGLLSRA